jgi:23S rRNA pseudouridine2605 synthase
MKDQHGVRLQKVLASAGVGSRRASEELIAQGRVQVNGTVIRSQGVRVNPATAIITVDGQRIASAPDAVHLALNKPRGMVTTMSDPEGRPSLGDLLQGRKQRLFHVGRLDADTEGLLLLTNDGELAHRLAHPSYTVLKTYLAEVDAPVPRDAGRRLRSGVELEDGLAQADSFRVVSTAAGRAMVELVVHEGRKHVVRRMLAAVGLPVRRLIRTRVGPVAMGDLRPGVVRPLTRTEVGQLYAEVGL